MRVRQYNNIPSFSLNIIMKVDHSCNVIVKNIQTWFDLILKIKIKQVHCKHLILSDVYSEKNHARTPQPHTHTQTSNHTHARKWWGVKLF